MRAYNINKKGCTDLNHVLYPMGMVYLSQEQYKRNDMKTMYLGKFVIGTLLLIAIMSLVNFIIYLVQFLNG